MLQYHHNIYKASSHPRYLRHFQSSPIISNYSPTSAKQSAFKMQFSNLINKLSSKAVPSSDSVRSSSTTAANPQTVKKMSAAQAYWSDPAVAYGFGPCTATSPRASISTERRSSATSSHKKAKKTSAAEAYWNDPVASYGFGPLNQVQRL